MFPKLISAKQFKALEAEKNTLAAKVTELENENAKLKEENKAHADTLADHNAHEVAMKAEFEKQINALKEEKAKVEVSTEEKAITALAQIGVPAEDMPKVSTEEQTPAALFAKWEGLKKTDPKAAKEFYSQNRETFIKFVGLQTQSK